MSNAPLYNHVIEGGRRRLALRTGVTTGTFAVTQLVSQERDPGWIVHEEAMEPWHIEGFRHQNGILYLYGPDIAVTPFEDLLANTSSEKPRLEATVKVYRAIRRLAEAGLALPALSLTALFITGDGGVLVAPPEIVSRSLFHLNEPEVARYVEHHTHPDLSGEKRDAMAFAVWTYRVLTGAWPYKGNSVAEIRDAFRSAPPQPPRALRPTLSEEVAIPLEELLVNPSEAAASHLRDVLEQGGTTDRPLSDAEAETIRSQETKRYGESERKLRRRRYLQKNWKRLVVVGALVLVVLSVPASLIRRAMEPSPLEGMPPGEVVKTFYYSMNEFDHVLMEDAVIERAAESKLREVTNLYVFSRMQGAMEGSSRFVDAQTWRNDGMPELRNGHHPYGVANLRIISSGQEGDRATVTVTYEKWEPAPPEEQEEPDGNVPIEDALASESDRFQGVLFFEFVERLHLISRDKQWFINEVETIERERRDPLSLLEES